MFHLDLKVGALHLPTITVPSIDHDIIVERSQSRKYIVQGCGVTSRAIREKVKESCHRQHVLFGR
jgi:hypothetical protein